MKLITGLHLFLSLSLLEENQKVSDNTVNLGVYGRIILKWTSQKQNRKVWIGCIWLRRGTIGRPL
jgi:hypothetical protein